MRGGPRSFPQGSPCLVVLWILPPLLPLRLRGSHPLWPVFPVPFRWARKWILQSEPRGARTPVWAPPVPLAATPGLTFVFFSSGYLDVSVRRVPLPALWIQARIHGVCPCGFPHSDTRGSQDICSSPRLFAAYHVFLRLSVPRHPPCALSCLTSQLHSVAASRFFLCVYQVIHLVTYLCYICCLSLGLFRAPMISRYLGCLFIVFWIFSIRFSRYVLHLYGVQMETKRFELSTPCLQGRCSPN